MFYEVSKVTIKTRVCADETRMETVKVSEVTEKTRVLIDKTTVLFVGTRRVIDRISDLFYETQELIIETSTRQIKFRNPTITADLVTERKSEPVDKTSDLTFV
jgi:hypothetical protein